MKLTIRSRKLNETFVFTKRDDGNHYIFLYSARSDHRPYGLQICRGGRLLGSTLLASDELFERVCRNWYRSHLKHV